MFVVNGRRGDFYHDARMVPFYFTQADVDGESVTDGVLELPPKASIVVRRSPANWSVAYLGGVELARPCPTGLLLVIAGGSIVCIVSIFRHSAYS